jgi:hypothetical protein
MQKEKQFVDFLQEVMRPPWKKQQNARHFNPDGAWKKYSSDKPPGHDTTHVLKEITNENFRAMLGDKCFKSGGVCLDHEVGIIVHQGWPLIRGSDESRAGRVEGVSPTTLATWLQLVRIEGLIEWEQQTASSDDSDSTGQFKTMQVLHHHKSSNLMKCNKYANRTYSTFIFFASGNEKKQTQTSRSSVTTRNYASTPLQSYTQAFDLIYK